MEQEKIITKCPSGARNVSYNRALPSFGIIAMSVLMALVTLSVGYEVF